VNLILTVLQIVAPVFLLAGTGFAWIRAGWDYPVGFVTQLAMTLAVPCLIFTALVETEIAPAALGTVAAAALATYAAVATALALLTRAAGLERRTYLAPLIFGNTGNLGLPLVFFAFAEEGLGYAVVVFAAMAVLQFTAGVWLVAGGGRPAQVLREPVVAATLLGALFLWQGWGVPAWLMNALELLGQMAIPLMLLTLGVAVGRLTPGRLGQAAWLSLVKAGVSGGVALAVGRAFGLEPVALAVLILQLMTPVAVTSYLLAEKYGADGDAVAGLVVVSTVMAVGTLPLTLALLI
jgi:hypothetical protein